MCIKSKFVLLINNRSHNEGKGNNATECILQSTFLHIFTRHPKIFAQSLFRSYSRAAQMHTFGEREKKSLKTNYSFAFCEIKISLQLFALNRIRSMWVRACLRLWLSNRFTELFTFKMKMVCRKLESNASMITLRIFDRFDFQLVRNPWQGKAWHGKAMPTICNTTCQHLHTHYIDAIRESFEDVGVAASMEWGTNGMVQMRMRKSLSHSFGCHLYSYCYSFTASATVVTAAIQPVFLAERTKWVRERSRSMCSFCNPFSCFYAIDMI